MVRRVRWSQAAANDLKHIYEFIAQDSEYYARRFVTRLRQAVQSLKEMPLSGPVVEKLEPTALRKLTYRAYRIIYHVGKSFIHVVAIVHSARNLRALWDREGRSRFDEDDQPSNGGDHA